MTNHCSQADFKLIRDLELGEPEDGLILAERQTLAVEHMSNSRHQPKLENWTLKTFAILYNQQYGDRFIWARRGQPPFPDYEVLSELGGPPLFVEITELLDPGRKRGDEYKSALAKARQKTGGIIPAEFVPDPPANYEEQLIEQARRILEQKFSKSYPDGTWLIVYFNPTSFTAFENDTLTLALRVVREATKAFTGARKVRQVWVLTNDLRIAETSL